MSSTVTVGLPVPVIVTVTVIPSLCQSRYASSRRLRRYRTKIVGTTSLSIVSQPLRLPCQSRCLLVTNLKRRRLGFNFTVCNPIKKVCQIIIASLGLGVLNSI